MDDVSLSKYLLFGTTKEQQKYTVQEGDTIADISFNNKISTEEFLIANDSFQDENALLYSGEEVTIGILKLKQLMIMINHLVQLKLFKKVLMEKIKLLKKFKK